ncbi:MAG: sigma-70 family RNA polymerase sigma factor [Prevotella sp.]|nr:sigma-70 family RNA polymerase sigma factor [Prevotella sp.]
METDEQIIEAVKDEKREGQRLMVSRYGQMVFAMIVRQVTTTMDAEELTQDTFMRAFNNIDRYDSRRSSLGTWLCRIAYHLTLDFLKRRHPNIISMDDTTDISDESLETELSTGNEKRIQQLEMLMEELPPDEQMLLTLYYYEDRTLDECSFIMDTTSHALANRLYRIRKKLYKQLKKQNENT